MVTPLDFGVDPLHLLLVGLSLVFGSQTGNKTPQGSATK